MNGELADDRAIREGIEAAERWPNYAQKFMALQFDSIRDGLKRLPCAPVDPAAANCFNAVVSAATAWARLVHAEMAREAVARDARLAIETAKWLGVIVPADVEACAGGNEPRAAQMCATREQTIAAHLLRAAEHTRISEIVGHLDDQQQRLADLGRELAERLDRIDYLAHEKLAQASPEACADIIAEGRANAQAVYTEFVAAAADIHIKARNAVTSLAAGLTLPQSSFGGEEDGD